MPLGSLSSAAPVVVRSPDRVLGAIGKLTCVLVLAVYGWIMVATVWEPLVTVPAEQPYNLQAAGFLLGQTKLALPVPPGLAALPNPYDPIANGIYRGPVDRSVSLHDLSFYRGSLHLYFGPTPVLALFAPWRALTGGDFSQELAVLVFCSAGFLLGAWLYRQLVRVFFPAASPLLFCGGLLGIGFVSGLPTLLLRPAIYEVAISCGQMFVLLTLTLIWRALQGPRNRQGWLACASVAYGLAVAARPSLLFGAIILLVPVLAAFRREGGKHVVGWLSAAMGPIAAVGIGLLLYNANRFGTPLEFGQRYQLAGIDLHNTTGFFNPGFAAFNFRLYFWEPLRWRTGAWLPIGIQKLPFPAGYFGEENPYGLLTNIPFVLFAGALLVRQASGAGPRGFFQGLPGCLWLMTAAAFTTLCVFGGACSRYEAEFLPTLTLLAGLGILALDESLARRTVARVIARGTVGLILIYSTAVGLLVGASEQSPHVTMRRIDLTELLSTGRVIEAAEGLVQHVKHYPKDVVALVNLGAAENALGRFPEALASYRRALEEAPRFVEANLGMGMVFSALGRTSEARTYFLRTLELRPGYRDALDGLARLEASAPVGEKK